MNYWPIWMMSALLVLIYFPLLRAEKALERWVVCYADVGTLDDYAPYSVIVLDADYHPPIEQFAETDKVVLGYISLGEVESERSHYNAVREEGILLEENPNWPGSYFVDLRDDRWVKRVVEELVPYVLFRRFDGLFFDTLDNAQYLEEQDPVKYAGMMDAAVRLVKAIRLHYPQIKLMMNRGFDIAPSVALELDYLLGESLYTDYDFAEKTPKIRPEEEYQYGLDAMRAAQAVNPNLGLFSLDYWDPSDHKTVKKIYNLERKNGMIPYVSTIDLNTIVKEPK